MRTCARGVGGLAVWGCDHGAGGAVFFGGVSEPLAVELIARCEAVFGADTRVFGESVAVTPPTPPHPARLYPAAALASAGPVLLLPGFQLDGAVPS